MNVENTNTISKLVTILTSSPQLGKAVGATTQLADVVNTVLDATARQACPFSRTACSLTDAAAGTLVKSSQKALSRIASVDAAGMVYDSAVKKYGYSRYTMSLVVKRMPLVPASGYQAAVGGAVTVVPNSLLSFVETIPRDSDLAIVMLEYHGQQPHSFEGVSDPSNAAAYRPLLSKVLDVSFYDPANSEKLYPKGLLAPLAIKIPLTQELSSALAQVNANGSRFVVGCVTYDPSTAAWVEFDKAARVSWCAERGGKSDKLAPTTPAKACPAVAQGELFTCRSDHATEFSLTYLPAGCDGTVRSSAVYDLCGDCDNGSNRCRDCSNVPNGAKVLDYCGICGGTNRTCVDCFGRPNGPARFDVCGVCGGRSTCVGCDGIPNSGLKFDTCGVCNGDNTVCKGCDGVANSGFERDRCGKCLAYNDPRKNACLDCNNVASGTSAVDKCGVCGGSNACFGCDNVRGSTNKFDKCGTCGGMDKCIGCALVAATAEQYPARAGFFAIRVKITMIIIIIKGASAQ